MVISRFEKWFYNITNYGMVILFLLALLNASNSPAANSPLKSVDGSSKVVEIANKKLASCRAQFPTKEDAFFHGVKEGASYTTCTGESTTVKIR